MEDVTDKINAVLNDNMSEQERAKIIQEVSRKLEEDAVKGTNLKANIKPYFKMCIRDSHREDCLHRKGS